MRIVSKGKTINLREPQFSGGEKDIYVQGGLAYCIFQDPANCIPDSKFRELNVLDSPVIMRPIDMVYDSKGKGIGFTTRFVQDTYTLAETFTKAFKVQHNYSQEDVLKNIRRLFEIVSFVHSKDCLIVDLNELNILTSKDLSSLYSIDVNSYQTKSYPATAIMESIRDWHAKEFSEETDWFSAAILSFYMFHGIHPFRGRNPNFKGNLGEVLKTRMLANCSVYDSSTKIPPVVYDLGSAPSTLRGWWKKTFEEGARLLPPSEFNSVVVVKPKQVKGSNLFKLSSLGKFSNLHDIHHGIKMHVWNKPGKLLDVFGDVKGVSIDGGKLNIQGYECDIRADSFCVAGNRLIYKNGTNIMQAEFRKGLKVVGSKVVGTITEYEGRLFDGIAIQKLMGRVHVTLFDANLNTQMQLPQLNEYRKILGAKYSKGVLIVVGIKDGKYIRSTFTFVSGSPPKFEEREMSGNWGINFVVNDKKVCVLINEDGCVEAFQVRSKPQPKVFDFDPLINGTLFVDGARVLLYKGDELFDFGVK